ncbi:hypothetical protein C8F01DRAFT_1171434 [Mycena amicta]|nr:hypothetical protein C8F01DRAFT_1171434 [Mycena amicta]
MRVAHNSLSYSRFLQANAWLGGQLPMGSQSHSGTSMPGGSPIIEAELSASRADVLSAMSRSQSQSIEASPNPATSQEQAQTSFFEVVKVVDRNLKILSEEIHLSSPQGTYRLVLNPDDEYPSEVNEVSGNSNTSDATVSPRRRTRLSLVQRLWPELVGLAQSSTHDAIESQSPISAATDGHDWDFRDEDEADEDQGDPNAHMDNASSEEVVSCDPTILVFDAVASSAAPPSHLATCGSEPVVGHDGQEDSFSGYSRRSASVVPASTEASTSFPSNAPLSNSMPSALSSHSVFSDEDEYLGLGNDEDTLSPISAIRVLDDARVGDTASESESGSSSILRPATASLVSESPEIARLPPLNVRDTKDDVTGVDTRTKDDLLVPKISRDAPIPRPEPQTSNAEASHSPPNDDEECASTYQLEYIDEPHQSTSPIDTDVISSPSSLPPGLSELNLISFGPFLDMDMEEEWETILLQSTASLDVERLQQRQQHQAATLSPLLVIASDHDMGCDSEGNNRGGDGDELPIVDTEDADSEPSPSSDSAGTHRSDEPIANAFLDSDPSLSESSLSSSEASPELSTQQIDLEQNVGEEDDVQSLKEVGDEMELREDSSDEGGLDDSKGPQDDPPGSLERDDHDQNVNAPDSPTSSISTSSIISQHDISSQQSTPGSWPELESPMLPELETESFSFTNAVLSSPEICRTGLSPEPTIALVAEPWPEAARSFGTRLDRERVLPSKNLGGPQDTQGRPRLRARSVSGTERIRISRVQDQPPALQLSFPSSSLDDDLLSARFPWPAVNHDRAQALTGTLTGSAHIRTTSAPTPRAPESSNSHRQSVLWAPGPVKYGDSQADPRRKKKMTVTRAKGHRRAWTISEGNNANGRRARFGVPEPRLAPAVVDELEATVLFSMRFGSSGAHMGLEDDVL